MKNHFMKTAVDGLKGSKTAFLCLGAGFCYLLAGQPEKARAALRDNEEPKNKRQDIGRLISELNAACENRSLLDRLKSRKGRANLLQSGTERLVGTDTCPGTTVPAGTAYTDSGTTAGADNTVGTVNTSCIFGQKSFYTDTPGPDVIYRFALPPLASRIPTCSISSTTSNNDGNIYILSADGTGCPSGINNSVTNCATGRDSSSGPDVETITDAQLDALPAGTYYLFIDSFYPGAAGSGPYTLNLNCTTVSVPTAAGVSVGGRVALANGTGLSRVTVSVTGSNGQIRTATTNSFGFYRFDSLPAGDTYTFQVSSRKYRFSNPTQVVSVNDNIANLNFEAFE